MAFSQIPGYPVMSDLLTIREKSVLMSLVEPQCKLIKTTVAQILEAKETESESPRWRCLHCGVVCLIEDEYMQSYFLRLYCVKRAKLLWEQELYIPFKYTATRTFFHTFPADDCQAGLNFANEIEAEEFHHAVETVREKMKSMTKNETADSSTSDPSDSGAEQVDNLDVQDNFPMDAPSTTTPSTPSSFKDLDPTMRRLLIQARFTEEDLKDKDIAEAVDCIIKQFGGLKAVQRALWNRGPVSQTLPRSAGASISQKFQKGALPPVPSFKDSTTSQKTPQGKDTLDHSQVDFWIPPPPPGPAPVLTESIRKSASFKHVGSPAAADRGDLILTALREVFRQKQMHQQSTSEEGTGEDLDTDNDVHL